MSPNRSEDPSSAIDGEKLALEREKWAVDAGLREREVAVQEAAQATRDARLQIERKQAARAGWQNPVAVAIFAAAVAATGNAVVVIANGILERGLESQKAEQARVLEMIRTGDPDKAAENLEFLLKAGLIDNPARAEKLRKFLADRKPGSGPTLPVAVRESMRRLDDDRRDLFREAMSFFEKRQWHEAIQALEKSVEVKPRPNARDYIQIYGRLSKYAYLPYFYMGVAYEELGDCTRALERLERSLEEGQVQTSARLMARLETIQRKCANP